MSRIHQRTKYQAQNALMLLQEKHRKLNMVDNAIMPGVIVKRLEFDQAIIYFHSLT